MKRERGEREGKREREWHGRASRKCGRALSQGILKWEVSLYC